MLLNKSLQNSVPQSNTHLHVLVHLKVDWGSLDLVGLALSYRWLRAIPLPLMDPAPACWPCPCQKCKRKSRNAQQLLQAPPTLMSPLTFQQTNPTTWQTPASAGREIYITSSKKNCKVTRSPCFQNQAMEFLQWIPVSHHSTSLQTLTPTLRQRGL